MVQWDHDNIKSNSRSSLNSCKDLLLFLQEEWMRFILQVCCGIIHQTKSSQTSKINLGSWTCIEHSELNSWLILWLLEDKQLWEDRIVTPPFWAKLICVYLAQFLSFPHKLPSMLGRTPNFLECLGLVSSDLESWKWAQFAVRRILKLSKVFFNIWGVLQIYWRGFLFLQSHLIGSDHHPTYLVSSQYDRSLILMQFQFFLQLGWAIEFLCN